MKKIGLFTANTGGGIAQYTFKFAEILHELGHKIVLITPNNFVYKDSRFIHIRYYKILNSAKLSNTEEVISKLNAHNLDILIFTDESIQSLLFSSESIFSSIVVCTIIHDPLPHISRFSVKNRIKEYLKKSYRKKYLCNSNVLCFPSKNSLNTFKGLKFQTNNNYYVLPLGEHLILNNPGKVKLNIPVNYFLFFGRIDKYKGLDILLKAYEKDTKDLLPELVIAGKGKISFKERSFIHKLSTKISVINRFITDYETKYLFENSKGVILPYVQASQSGVIPIAYKFKVPVICSDLPGLVEFIEPGKTGFIFRRKDPKDLYSKMLSSLHITPVDNWDENTKSISKLLDWNENISKMIEYINEIRTKNDK